MLFVKPPQIRLKTHSKAQLLTVHYSLSTSPLSLLNSPSPRLPYWLKRNVPKGNAGHFTRNLLDSLCLATVCEHAKCPNRMECYAKKTATFLLLGPVCTRNCRFCGVQSGKPLPVDHTEPQRVAEAVQKLGLAHVVLTCVSRDDLPDGGAEHFCRTIDAIRGTSQAVTIEVLPSDFAGCGIPGRADSVDRLADAAPEVYNYNTETVPRLFRAIRGPIPDFDWTLEIFRRIRRRRPTVRCKSGLMLGIGPWTPWQMFSWGTMGLLAGWLKGPLERSKPLRVIYGAVWGYLFGWVMNLWTLLTVETTQSGWAYVITTYAASLPFDTLHAVANVTLLWLGGDSYIRILRRMIKKYGIGGTSK